MERTTWPHSRASTSSWYSSIPAGERSYFGARDETEERIYCWHCADIALPDTRVIENVLTQIDRSGHETTALTMSSHGEWCGQVCARCPMIISCGHCAECTDCHVRIDGDDLYRVNNDRDVCETCRDDYYFL